MQTQLITEEDAIEAIADEWNALDLPSPMQSPHWLIPWWQVYGGGNRELAVLAVRDEDDTLVGLCPWYVESSARGRRVRWLGDGHACSDHASIVVASHAASRVIQTVGDWLDDDQANLRAHWSLESVDADDSILAALTRRMTQRGWLLTARNAPGTSCIELPKSWEEYLATLSKNHRKRCRKWTREFFDTGRAGVQIATDPAECRAVFDDLVRLHNGRRQSAGMRGAFQDERFRRFHQLAIPRLAGQGSLQLRLLTIDEELLAIEYLLVDEKAFYAYQSGMSAAGEAVSAGNLSILAILSDAFAHGLERVDLLRGTEPYKFSWGAVHHAAQTNVLRRKSVAALMQTCFDAVLERAKEFKGSSRRTSTGDCFRAAN